MINVGLTSVAMLGLPSRESYDPWWTSNGFCVVEGGASSIPTELLCFLSLSSSAVAAYLLSRNRRVWRTRTRCC